MPAQVDQEKCEGCGDCVDQCPNDSITLENDKATVNQDDCIDCELCVDACPTDAIAIVA